MDIFRSWGCSSARRSFSSAIRLAFSGSVGRVVAVFGPVFPVDVHAMEAPGCQIVKNFQSECPAGSGIGSHGGEIVGSAAASADREEDLYSLRTGGSGQSLYLGQARNIQGTVGIRDSESVDHAGKLVPLNPGYGQHVMFPAGIKSDDMMLERLALEAVVAWVRPDVRYIFVSATTGGRQQDDQDNGLWVFPSESYRRLPACGRTRPRGSIFHSRTGACALYLLQQYHFLQSAFARPLPARTHTRRLSSPKASRRISCVPAARTSSVNVATSAQAYCTRKDELARFAAAPTG